MDPKSGLKGFEVLNKLGEGAFGQVFKVRRYADGKEYALKKVKIGAMKEKERDNALNEIRILASYQAEYIIGYKQAFYDENSSTLCVVMEFAAGGDILKTNQTHLKSRTTYKEDELWKALVHMTKGLKSLHDKSILHRDLKCANVFITADKVYKLGDLNVSKVLHKEMADTQTGTPYYASPEVWKDKPYAEKSDIWSLGCVLYEMAALKPPFVAANLEGLYKRVCAGVFERIPMIYSNDLATIIGSMLKVDPSKRPDVDQILANEIVRKRFSEEMDVPTEQEIDKLLQTIKYNPKDLKGLKNILPKANYEEDLPREKVINERQVSSCKNSRKEPNVKKQIESALNQNDLKLKDYLEKRQMTEELQRQKKNMQPLASIPERDEFKERRERALSACKVRQPEIYTAPKIAVAKPNDNPKMEVMKPMPKLPPKPNSVMKASKQPQKAPQQVVAQLVLREKESQMVRPRSSSGSVRSSSGQKVMYPSWWG